MPPRREPTNSANFAIVLLMLGAFAGFWLGGLQGRHVERHAARAELAGYAQRLLSNSEDLGRETEHIFSTVSNDHLPFCSDAELSMMRHLVYDATFVRDIGRTQGDTLVCASGVGRLATPLPLTPADIESDGFRVSADRPLILAKDATGFVVERGKVSVVLNPMSYNGLDEPPMLQSAWLYLSKDHLLLHAFGHPMSLSQEEVTGGQLIEKNGIVYFPLCNPSMLVCVAAAEPQAEMERHSVGTISWFRIVGGILGGLMASVVLLLFRSHRSVERQLRRAIASNALTVEYQPIVELTTGRIVCAEALVRWTDESGQPVRPDLFIALAEDKRFVSAITRYVASTAIRDMAEALGEGNFRVTLNIAAQDLDDDAFARFLKRSLEDHNLPAQAIGLELTERSTANHSQAISAIRYLKSNGHAVYLDDFGTGYSSLAYLHQLGVDAIKIDQAFTQTVGTDAVTASVVPQILNIARELDLLVVVEGIETPGQAEYFAAAGIRILGQGWFFGRPVSAAGFLKRLRSQTGRRAVAE